MTLRTERPAPGTGFTLAILASAALWIGLGIGAWLF